MPVSTDLMKFDEIIFVLIHSNFAYTAANVDAKASFISVLCGVLQIGKKTTNEIKLYFGKFPEILTSHLDNSYIAKFTSNIISDLLLLLLFGMVQMV